MLQRPHDVTRAALIGLSFASVCFIAAGTVVWLTGGIRTDVFGLPLRSTDPLKPIGIGAALAVVRLLAGAT